MANPRQSKLCIAALTVGLSACRDSPDFARERPSASNVRVAPAARYVGSSICFDCHAEAARAWAGSDHDWAMALVGSRTLLGRFDGTSLELHGETFRFEQEDERSFVHVSSPEGSRRFEVTHTFGVRPLQQVLLATERGRLQALSLAWDARPQTEGGQRWYPLQPNDDARPGAPLHWAGPAYTWNSRCAACHSTAVDRGYRVDTDSYATRDHGIDVGCEACHGPGSEHVRWAEAGAEGDDLALAIDLTRASDRRWVLADGAAIARLESAPSSVEAELCAGCHARRSELGPIDPAEGFHDLYQLSLLERGLYFDDGQMRDEVFVYGSFLQSKMHAAGVTCSDCHEPHSLELRGRERGPNATCTSCHRATVFDTPSHHFHAPDSEAARCVACHMPARVYMGIDARRDHRFAVPQPLLSAKLGSPDPCMECHAERDPGWAAAVIDEHFGPRPPRWDFATALWLAREEQLGGAAALADVVLRSEGPAIIRATALVELAAHPGPAAVLHEAISVAASSEHAILRRAAASAARTLGRGPHDQLILSLLHDPARSVRIEAATNFLGIDSQAWPARDREALANAIDEYRASLLYNADWAEALVDLAQLDATAGNLDAAQTWLERASRIDPSFTAAYVNHADLLRVRGDDEGALAVLRAGLSRAAEPAVLHHALGLALVRVGDRRAALVELGRAHELAPEDPQLAYVHALALFGAGQTDVALASLVAVHERRPANLEILAALTSHSRELGHWADAERYAAKLRALLAADTEHGSSPSR